MTAMTSTIPTTITSVDSSTYISRYIRIRGMHENIFQQTNTDIRRTVISACCRRSYIKHLIYNHLILLHFFIWRAILLFSSLFFFLLLYYATDMPDVAILWMRRVFCATADTMGFVTVSLCACMTPCIWLLILHSWMAVPVPLHLIYQYSYSYIITLYMMSSRACHLDGRDGRTPPHLSLFYILKT